MTPVPVWNNVTGWSVPRLGGPLSETAEWVRMSEMGA